MALSAAAQAPPSPPVEPGPVKVVAVAGGDPTGGPISPSYMSTSVASALNNLWEDEEVSDDQLGIPRACIGASDFMANAWPPPHMMQAHLQQPVNPYAFSSEWSAPPVAAFGGGFNPRQQHHHLMALNYVSSASVARSAPGQCFGAPGGCFASAHELQSFAAVPPLSVSGPAPALSGDLKHVLDTLAGGADVRAAVSHDTWRQAPVFSPGFSGSGLGASSVDTVSPDLTNVLDMLSASNPVRDAGSRRGRQSRAHGQR